MYLIG